jgi:peptidoglycan/LPS O-acetylase OafA/YrhL
MTLYTLQINRFIAALLVLFSHLGLVYSGYKGVDIFFVISGYVMYHILFIEKPKSSPIYYQQANQNLFFILVCPALAVYSVAFQN